MPPILVPSSAKRIATQILVIAKLNGKEDFILRGFVWTTGPKIATKAQWKLFKIKEKDTWKITILSF